MPSGKVYHCEGCGINLTWQQVQRYWDKNGKEHRVCIDCAHEKGVVCESIFSGSYAE